MRIFLSVFAIKQFFRLHTHCQTLLKATFFACFSTFIQLANASIFALFLHCFTPTTTPKEGFATVAAYGTIMMIEFGVSTSFSQADLTFSFNVHFTCSIRIALAVHRNGCLRLTLGTTYSLFSSQL
eukprot:09217.XXX_485048_485425_1 [CDS] Oithona nana genome sequencing.